MWREESGIVEMLFTYIGEYESFSGWRSWRSIVVEILACHEDVRRDRLTEASARSVGSDGTVNSSKLAQDTSVSPIQGDNHENRDDEWNGFSSFDKVMKKESAVEQGSVKTEDADRMLTQEANAWTIQAISTDEEDSVIEVAVKTEQLDDKPCASDSLSSRHIPQNEPYDAMLPPSDDHFSSSNQPIQSISVQPRSSAQPAFHPSLAWRMDSDGYLSQSQATHSIPPSDPVLYYGQRIDRSYICRVCGKTFSTNTNLRNHVRIHTGEKPFKCRWCGRSFTVSNHLKNHIRIHTGEKPYACHVCGRSFSVNTHLKRHMSTHTGEKPFMCSSCGKTFARKDNLKTHIKMHTSCNDATI